MMKYNLIAVIDQDKKNVLMCKKTQKIYEDKYNFVGGHINPKEKSEVAAYRELFEETGITNQDIKLIHLADIYLKVYDIKLEFYYGVLSKDVTLVEEINPLEWTSLEEYFNSDKFAGEGDIGYIINLIKNELFYKKTNEMAKAKKYGH